MERRFVLKENGLQIPCVLTEPEHCAPNRCIIGVHGFCGNKDNSVLVDLAEEMSIFGAAVIRFDFPAHGDSPATAWGLSLERCTDTLLTVAAWVQKQYPDLEVGIFAVGYGAFVMLVQLDELKEMFDRLKLVMLSPDLHMAQTLLSLSKQTEESFHKLGRITMGSATKRPVEVSYSFYEEVQDQMVYQNYQMPMLLLRAEKDKLVPMSYLEPFCRFNRQSKLVLIPDADYQFRGEGQWDMVVDLTRDWFQCEQVLLCDWI